MAIVKLQIFKCGSARVEKRGEKQEMLRKR